MPGQAGGVGRLCDAGAPEWQEPVTLGVGVLEEGGLPLVPGPGLAHGGQVTVHVHQVEVAHGREAHRLPHAALRLLERCPPGEGVDGEHLARLEPEEKL